MTWVLNLIEELPSVPTKYFKKLVNTDAIWEVRVAFGGDIFRLLGFIENGQFVMLNHAFQKKTQKTPRQEIKIAEKRKRDYLKKRTSNE